MRAFRAYRKYLAKYEPQDTRSKGGFLIVPAAVTLEDTPLKVEEEDAEADARLDLGSKF